MIDDYNKDELKTEKMPASEFIKPETQGPVKEFGSVQKSKKIAKVASVVFTIVGAGLVLGGIVEYSFVYKPTAVITQFEIAADENNIYYDIVVNNMEPETITLKVYNQFTNRKEQIIMGENVGSFTSLAPNMEYTVSIVEKDVLVMKKKIVTRKMETKESE